MRTPLKLLLIAATVVGMTTSSTASAAPPAPAPTATQLLTGLQGGAGSTVGPGGALYVTAPPSAASGASTRKPATSRSSPAGCRRRIRIGGVIDVAFIGGTAYALVTGVGPDFGGNDIVGIYRVDGPNSFTVIADIGAFSMAIRRHPRFYVPTGFQFAIETYRGGFLVTDGHHNRVLSGHPRRRDHRVDPVRQHRPDGAGRPTATRSTSPRPDPFPTFRRTARSCR